MISIESIEFKNFLGYGDYVTKVLLSKYAGISQILGEFEENDLSNPGDEKRIGSGKSSLIEAVVWCLFGHLTYLEKPGDSVVNWHTGKNCSTKITTTDGYEIIRTRKVAGSNELIILKNGEDITRSTTVPSQDFLNNLFKIDYRTFIVSVVYGQLSEGFLNVSDAKRRTIFERFIKITSFNAIALTAKDKVSKLTEDISVLETKIGSLNNSKSSLEHEINGLLLKTKEFDENKTIKINNIKLELLNNKSIIDKQIDNIKKQIDELNGKIKNFTLSNIDEIKQQWDSYEKTKITNDANLTKITGLNQLKSKFENKLNNTGWELKDLTTKLDNIKLIDENLLIGSWDKFNKASEKLKELRNDIIKINDDVRDLKFNTQKLRDDIKNITNIKEEQLCPKCFHEITNDHVCSIINDKTLKIDSMIPTVSQLENKKTEISEIIIKLESIDEPEISVDKLKFNIKEADEIKLKINPLNESRLKLAAGIKDIENQIKSIEIVDLTRPQMTIEEAKDQLNEYNNFKKDIEIKQSEIIKLNSRIKEEILKIQIRINEIKNSENPYESLVSGKKSNLNDITIDISKQQDELNKQRKLKMHVDYIRDSYYNKKKMRAFWISEIIPTFNKFIKYYFDTFEIEDKVEFDEFLNVKIDRWGYKTHSGGEKKRIDLSIMFALNDLHASVFGPQCNLMVLDEVDGRIDPFTTNRLVTLLNDDIIKRNSGLTNIFIISHKEIMRDKFPHQIKVKNKGGNSYIVNE
jgi:DNA repair exonuclease SbcCD ATPase subunit